jgi:5-methylcytosine-specific restriction endonuclease McrA
MKPVFLFCGKGKYDMTSLAAHIPFHQRRVLILNKAWAVIGTCGMARAIHMLFSTYKNGEPKARIIDPNEFTAFSWSDWSVLAPKDGEDVIRGHGKDFRVPEVIVLSKYDKFPLRKVKFNRKTLYRRDGFRCGYCGGKFSSDLLSIDHIVPRSRGGTTVWTNVTTSCVPCNSKKGSRLLSEAGMELRIQPTKPQFDLFKHDSPVRPKSWDAFLSEAYWSVPLENDNQD